MATQHTPGPWRFTERYDSRYWTHYVQPDGKPCFDSFALVNGEDNARLMAAAPDLLDALRKCVIELDAMHGYLYPTCEGGCPFEDAITQARAAIAHATGQEA
jgi:hypothetical protein